MIPLSLKSAARIKFFFQIFKLARLLSWNLWSALGDPNKQRSLTNKAKSLISLLVLCCRLGARNINEQFCFCMGSF